MFGWLLLGVGAIVFVLVVAVALTVDDWSRDLVTNHAATDEHSPDPALRPIRTDGIAADLAAVVVASAQTLPNWRMVSQEVDPAAATIRLVRTTPLWRFRDDITVRISVDGDESVIAAESRSRVGKGDLGQNPRNLRELLTEVRERLDKGLAGG